MGGPRGTNYSAVGTTFGGTTYSMTVRSWHSQRAYESEHLEKCLYRAASLVPRPSRSQLLVNYLQLHGSMAFQSSLQNLNTIGHSLLQISKFWVYPKQNKPITLKNDDIMTKYFFLLVEFKICWPMWHSSPHQHWWLEFSRDLECSYGSMLG